MPRTISIPVDVLGMGLTDGAKLIFGVLYSFSLEERRWPTSDELQQILKYDSPRIVKHLRELEHARLIRPRKDSYYLILENLSIFPAFAPIALLTKTPKTEPIVFPLEAQELLTYWEQSSPLPKTCNRTQCLKVLTRLHDDLPWDTIKGILDHALKEWVPKGYMASPAKLDSKVRSGEMKVWEAILRQLPQQPSITFTRRPG